MPTVSDIINIAKYSQTLAVTTIEKNGLFGGSIDHQLPRKLYIIRKNVEWLYDLDSSDTTLDSTANYLYGLCAPFIPQATYMLSIATGGSIAQTTTGVFGINWLFLTSGQFASATDYEDDRLKNKTYRLYWSEIDDYFQEGDWEYLPGGGFRITLDGFDSSTTMTKGIYLDFRGQGIPLSSGSGGDSSAFTGDI